MKLHLTLAAALGVAASTVAAPLVHVTPAFAVASPLVVGSVSNVPEARPGEVLAVGMSADGTEALAVWLHDVDDDPLTAGFQVLAAAGTVRGSTVNWGAARLIASDPSEQPSDITVRLSEDGTRATVAWSSLTTYLDDTPSVGGAKTLSMVLDGTSLTSGSVTSLTDRWGRFSLLMSADGSRVTLISKPWDPYNPTTPYAFSATVSGTTQTWGNKVNLSSNLGGLQLQKASLSADGTKIAVSALAADGVYVSFGTVSGTTQTWGALEHVFNDPNVLPTEDGVFYSLGAAPVILSADGSRATVAWIVHDGVSDRLATSRVLWSRSATVSGTAGSWGSATPIATNADSPLTAALSADGSRVTLAWTAGYRCAPFCSVNYVKSRSATISGTTQSWGSTTSLHKYAGCCRAVEPGLRMSADGSVVTAWYSRGTSFSSPKIGDVVVRTASLSGATANWGAASTIATPADEQQVEFKIRNVLMSQLGTQVLVLLGRAVVPVSLLPDSVLSALPVASGTPLTDAVLLNPGQSVTASSGGFAPGEFVQMVVQSAPQLIGSGYANDSGVVTLTGTLPAKLKGGTHTLSLFAPGSGQGVRQSVRVSPTVPLAPVSPGAVFGNGSVVVSWSAPNSGGRAVSKYVVQKSTDQVRWTSAGSAKGSASSLRVKKLKNGVTYWFRIAAKNKVGTGPWSAAVSETPRSVPGVPGSLSAAAANGAVVLTWAAPKSDGGSVLLDYRIQQSTDGKTFSDVVDGVSTTAGFTVTGLSNGVKYWFRVAAINAVGTGNNTGSKTATPAAPPA